jgi:ABC-type transport system substrate-binding protein
VLTPPPSDPGTLVVGVARDPVRMLPPAEDPASALLVDVLYDPLYRLDETLTPVPELAAGLPLVSADGLTWTITLAGHDLRFADGSPLRPSDVVFSLRLARSPACSFGRDLCDLVAGALDEIEDTSGGGGGVEDPDGPGGVRPPPTVSLTLREPFAPFLAGVLAQLPIVSESAVREGVAAITDAAADMDPGAPDALVTRVAEATNADACLSEAPPFGCRLADHTAPLEQMLTSAGVGLPPREAWTNVTGTFDAEAYGGALLDRVAALGNVLSGRPIDREAAALGLLDPVAGPFGSGPYRIERWTPGRGLELVANPFHVGGPPGIERIFVRVVPDTATAATLLLTGDLDWLPSVPDDQLPALAGAPGVVLGVRPLATQRTIVFNTRPGRVFDDARTRRAFARCLDRESLAADATDGAAIAVGSWGAPGSWAFPAFPGVPRDTAEASGLLDEAGWAPGPDGIRVRGGQRLSSAIAIRPTRTDLLAFATGAATSLRECGIELVVEDLDLTGNRLLEQLQWPNDFETVLIARPLAVDPDGDMEPYDGARATTEEDPADANPGGYRSEAVDALIAEGRRATTVDLRGEVYRRLAALLDADVPAWPIWYDTAAAAISERVSTPAGPVDPGRPRYAWDLAAWSLRPAEGGRPSLTPDPRPSL